MGDNGSEWMKKNDDEDIVYQEVLAKRRTALRRKTRELRLSSGSSQREHHRDPEVLVAFFIFDSSHVPFYVLASPFLLFVLCRSHSLRLITVEKERVRLWNERMIGKELDGMSFHELMVFKIEIQNGLFKVMEEKLRPSHSN
ncbi:unnamed protein product [Microthlaspi erraticum]|uniref:Uncharacterized protein n=1 Tax=Microthlaspi erraticum TaxID=1685480 RepID=A0A6D2KJA6_9BRAS|nr:unnamed protein product [Microthlaspi erraticum]CAA7060197.1 unnamed protein product [Microthlaspi erraticum]